MLGLRKSTLARLREPNIRSSIENAAAELGALVEIVKLAHDLDDETLDKLAWQGDALLDRIVEYRALSLDDVLLKLELWRRLPPDLWNTARVIASVAIDLKELRDCGVCRASGACSRTGAPIHGGAKLARLIPLILYGLIESPAHVMQRRAGAEMVVPKSFWQR